MSRVAKAPIVIPESVEVELKGQEITIKNGKSALKHQLHTAVQVAYENNVIQVSPVEGINRAGAQAGTARALLNNMVIGVTKGFEKKLILKGVGYRATVKGNVLQLSLGLSHPVEHSVPEDVTVECPSQTEIVLKSANKQVLGQVAADIRSYREPEPYKGKGIRYADEVVRTKEAKKK